MNNQVGLIAKKVGMSRMVDDQGQLTAVTILQAADQSITKKLTDEKDGYTAVQIGFYEKAERKLTKSDVARLRKNQIAKNYSKFKEFRVAASSSEEEGYELGNQRTVELFNEVSSIDVTGVMKGRGFQGTVKRYNTKTGRRTHGSHFHRRPGSLGNCTTPGRVMKNKKQPGRMGGNQVTVLNLKVLEVDVETNTIAIKGSVPGAKNGFLILRPSIKTPQKKSGGKK